ncbi:MAG: hypothetical protein ACREQI_10460 [Candidatus Binataceae bacterium]
MSRLPLLIKAGLALYAIGIAISAICLLDTTALTMTIFFSAGVGSFGLGFLAYAKAVWDDLRAHGVL